MDNHSNEETFEIELAAAVSRPKINSLLSKLKKLTR